MARALARAKAVTGVDASTTAYTSYQISEPNRPMRWRVSQTLALESSEFAILSSLVTKLQASDGLVLSGLTFSVSTTTRRAADDALMQQAIRRWQQRAENAARGFGATGYRTGRVTIQTNDYGRPQPMLKAGMRLVVERDSAVLDDDVVQRELRCRCVPVSFAAKQVVDAVRFISIADDVDLRAHEVHFVEHRREVDQRCGGDVEVEALEAYERPSAIAIGHREVERARAKRERIELQAAKRCLTPELLRQPGLELRLDGKRQHEESKQRVDRDGDRDGNRAVADATRPLRRRRNIRIHATPRSL